MMEEYHQQHPEYDFAKHKGYGTKEHRQAIECFEYVIRLSPDHGSL
jgi:ribonuclease HII